MKLKLKKKKKEPAAKPERDQKSEAGKKPKLEKKIYIIVCAALVFLLAGVVTLILMITTGSKEEKALKKEPEASAVGPSPEGEAEPEPSGEEGPPEEEPKKDPEPDDEREPEKEPGPKSKANLSSALALALDSAPKPGSEPSGDLLDEMHISLSDAVNFVEKLSPSLLNLPGESMAEYEILTNQYIIPVDGLLCSEVMVYNRDDSTGTNELMATLLVDRGPDGRLFRKERETGEVVEVDLAAGG